MDAWFRGNDQKVVIIPEEEGQELWSLFGLKSRTSCPFSTINSLIESFYQADNLEL